MSATIAARAIERAVIGAIPQRRHGESTFPSGCEKNCTCRLCIEPLPRSQYSRRPLQMELERPRRIGSDIVRDFEAEAGRRLRGSVRASEDDPLHEQQRSTQRLLVL